MTRELCYIPLERAEAMREAGWTVEDIRTAKGELAAPHAAYSMLAWREVEE